MLELLSDIRDKLISIVSSRLFLLLLVITALFASLTVRLFVLQIVKGEDYRDNFTLKIEREKSIKSTRGTIYDRNGNTLAQDTLAYSVTLIDNYDSGEKKNMQINRTLDRLIEIIERNGDKVVSDFSIVLGEDGKFEFTLDGTRQTRFLADVFGRQTVDSLKYQEKMATANDVINYLCSKERYGIGLYVENDDGTYQFAPREGYSNRQLLKLVNIRWNLSLNNFQKYLSTTIATNVTQNTVAEVMENKDVLQGVDIEEDTIRTYIDDPSLSHILGYTGRISEEELSQYNKEDSDSASNHKYALNDMVGKSGIEQVMEKELQGIKGSQRIFVDNLGRITEEGDRKEPTAGHDLYLTIDSRLQSAIYRILEQKIAGIVLSKIRNIKWYNVGEYESAADIILSIDQIYFALIDNNFIDCAHFGDEDAGLNEGRAHEFFQDKLQKVSQEVRDELLTGKTVYSELRPEMQEYESYITEKLESSEVGIFDSSKMDKANEWYKNWKEGKISLSQYLENAIASSWVQSEKIVTDQKYLESSEIYDALVSFITEDLMLDNSFAKKIYKYLIMDGTISGEQIIHIIYEQGKLLDTDGKLARLDAGESTAYSTIVGLIRELKITPANLALDPCSGSCVVTEVDTGKVLACVSYPSYDNKRLANNVDAAYFNSLQKDGSLPLYNYATQQKTAPGSTFKPCTSTAALEEKIVNQGEQINCLGIYEKVDHPPRCWIYPKGTHGNLDIVGAIEHSCNYFFYECGYRLSIKNGRYDSDTGLKAIAKYADLFGLSEKSGIEITESEPKVSDIDSVRSAIGQGNHTYTTVGLARYVNTIANNGNCYNLSLLDRLVDADGEVLSNYVPSLRNKVEVADSTWNAVHRGMREAVLGYGAYKNFPVAAAGKTGTAQQMNTRPNHSLFISYAPFHNPEISIATRIAYGYTSSNAAEVTRDVYKYYFDLEDESELIPGTAVMPDSVAISD